VCWRFARNTFKTKTKLTNKRAWTRAIWGEKNSLRLSLRVLHILLRYGENHAQYSASAIFFDSFFGFFFTLLFSGFSPATVQFPRGRDTNANFRRIARGRTTIFCRNFCKIWDFVGKHIHILYAQLCFIIAARWLTIIII